MLLLVSVDAELEHCGDKILDRHPLPQCNLTNDVILMSVQKERCPDIILGGRLSRLILPSSSGKECASLGLPFLKDLILLVSELDTLRSSLTSIPEHGRYASF